MTETTVYVIQYTYPEAPAGSRSWVDHWETRSSLIIATGTALTEQQKDPTRLFRVIRRHIREEVVSGPED